MSHRTSIEVIPLGKYVRIRQTPGADGKDWVTITLLDCEAKKVRDELDAYLNALSEQNSQENSSERRKQ